MAYGERVSATVLQLMGLLLSCNRALSLNMEYSTYTRGRFGNFTGEGSSVFLGNGLSFAHVQHCLVLSNNTMYMAVMHPFRDE